MSNIKKIFIVLSFLFIASCDYTSTSYKVTVDGYKANFSGYYYIDGSFLESFEGANDFTDSSGYSHFYYEKELESFDSIKIYTFKNSEQCSLTVTLWYDNEELTSLSSSENEYQSYSDDDGDGVYTYVYKYSLDPLYYSTSTDSSDDSTTTTTDTE